MEYDDYTEKISIRDLKNQVETSFKLDDISEIFHTMTKPMAEKRMHWFPWDSYNYSKIYLKDGRTFLITSLMINRLQLPVDGKYQIVTKFFPYPS